MKASRVRREPKEPKGGKEISGQQEPVSRVTREMKGSKEPREAKD